MRRTILAVAALLSAGCHAFHDEPLARLEGRLVLDVVPNPIIASPVGENWYEMDFEIVMREEGGVGVRIEDFTVEAIAFQAVPVRRETFPSTYITDRGYPAEVGAGEYLRFGFTKRWQLPAPLLLSGASARVTARTVDANGVRNESKVRVGVEVRR